MQSRNQNSTSTRANSFFLYITTSILAFLGTFAILTGSAFADDNVARFVQQGSGVEGLIIEPVSGDDWPDLDRQYDFNELITQSGSVSDDHVIDSVEFVSGRTVRHDYFIDVIREGSGDWFVQHRINPGVVYRSGETFNVSVTNMNVFLAEIDEAQDDLDDEHEDDIGVSCEYEYVIESTTEDMQFTSGEIGSGEDHLAVQEDCTDGNGRISELHWFQGLINSEEELQFGLADNLPTLFVNRSNLSSGTMTGSPVGPTIEITRSERVEPFLDDWDQASYESGLDSDNDEGPQCEASGLSGFFICDIILTMIEWLSDFQEMIAEMLFHQDPISLEPGDDDRYPVWSNVRDIANALLVLAFMAIIFSLALSVNVDAYTIKRMVPRLLVAAVAIQASFFISAAMIDVTNVLGQGLQGFSNIALDELVIDDTDAPGAAGSALGGGVMIGAVALGAGAVAATAAPGILGFLGLIVLAAVLIILGALLIIAIRELLITLCIIISPIAFLANLLPSTEKYFKMWWSNFARLLLMYPFMVLMIQIGNIASYMMLSGDAGSDAAFLRPIFALLMQTVAFGSLFLAFKVSGSMLSYATGGLQKFARGGGGGKKGADGKGIRGRFKKRYADGKAEYAAGTRGSTLTQGLAAPGSKLSRKGRSDALTAMNAKTGELSKQFEAEEIDDEALAAFAESAHSNQAYRAKRRELVDEHGADSRQVRSFDKTAKYAGNRAAQIAAFKKAAKAGRATDEGFQAMSQVAGPQADEIRRQAGRDAEKAGRVDQAVQYGGRSAAEAVERMTPKFIAEDLKPDALSGRTRASTQLREEFQRAATDEAHPAHRAVVSSFAQANGMSGEKHALFSDGDGDYRTTNGAEGIAPVLGREVYDHVYNEANRRDENQPPSGGAAGPTGGATESPSGGGTTYTPSGSDTTTT